MNLGERTILHSDMNCFYASVELLSHPEFIRTHRSYIVNMLHVSELSPGSVRTFSGKQLPVSRRLYPQLQKNYMRLLFHQREE